MYIKTGSILAFAIAVAGVVYMVNRDYILSDNLLVICIQVAAVALMIWSRITFGRRSFHAAANATEGQLVTSGPYKYFRHPIYASLIYFFSACLIAFATKESLIAVLLIVSGLFARMLFEEKSLYETYPEYAAYASKTKRIIPYIF